MNGRAVLPIALGAAALLLISALLTGWVRRLALAHKVLDVPNKRSSHRAPTPRGGGMAIVVSLLAAVAVLGAVGLMPSRLATALWLSGGVVAVVGFLDDKRHVAATVRLTVHFAAVSLFVWSRGRLPPIDFGIAVCDMGYAGSVVGILALVWFLNLYNFMDGIDGIASVEAISIAAAAALILVMRGIESPAIPLLLFMAAAVGGFLVWNWPPARIFMGDAGSGFLGFVLGAIAWTTAASGELSVWFWLILFGAFFVDATLTLLRRWRLGEPLAAAHRSHAYQRLSRRLGSHRTVTLGCLAVNVLWLAPLAWLAAARPSWGALLVLVAWAPLCIYVWRSGAGLPD
ncbi:MAG TPA: glycosyltransferase family 4 protein [Steroidobacteraceae bacterium]|nr:glycosyltransferase family 4 protein [Steroidobacteraceae bacterium]